MHLMLTDEAKYASAGLIHILSTIGEICVRMEGIAGAFQAGLLLTDDAGMLQINRARRDVEAATDVLSFPSVSFSKGTAKDHPSRFRKEWDADTGRVHLGDIAISHPRAKAQARRYRHSFLREIGFLYAHGMLHLFGYDHQEKQARVTMRAMEDAIMKEAGLDRELSPDDQKMVDCAWEALETAYAPYSEYLVGACVQDSEGRLFKGCNVENASFGLTICAERNAITTAVTEGMTKIKAIAVVSRSKKKKAAGKVETCELPSPCGACRQFMREFAKDMKVILACPDGAQITSLSALLPQSFGPESLESNQEE